MTSQPISIGKGILGVLEKIGHDRIGLSICSSIRVCGHFSIKKYLNYLKHRVETVIHKALFNIKKFSFSSGLDFYVSTNWISLRFRFITYVMSEHTNFHLTPACVLQTLLTHLTAVNKIWAHHSELPTRRFCILHPSQSNFKFHKGSDDNCMQCPSSSSKEFKLICRGFHTNLVKHVIWLIMMISD